jgi:hypothetical protein
VGSLATANFGEFLFYEFVLYLCGRFDPSTTEKLYFQVYVRYESKLTSVRILLSLSPPITPMRALALSTQTVPMLAPSRNPCLNRLRDV